MTHPADLIRAELRSNAWRIRAWRALQLSLWAMLGAQLVVIIIMLFDGGTSASDVALTDAYILICAAAAGGVIGFIAPLPPRAVARLLDAELDLKERTQTSLEIDPKHPLAQALADDALRRLRQPKVKNYHRGLLQNLKWKASLGVSLGGIALLVLLQSITSFYHSRAKTDFVANVGDEQNPISEKAKGATRKTRPLTANSVAQLLTASPQFKDASIASKPPDFASFLISSEKLEFLGPKARDSSTEAGQTSAMSQSAQSSRATFESDLPASAEISERMAELDAVLNNATKAWRNNEKNGRRSSSGGGAKSSALPGGGEPGAEQNGSQTRDPDNAPSIAPTDKGLAKESLAADETSRGTSSSDQVQPPSRAATKPLDNDDNQTARYGGGQYPHNAPGAGFPDWMRGDEDPHFMDAGQGEGKSTGKTSGQAGVGHAVPKRGPETKKENVRTAEDLFLRGKRSRDGQETAYDAQAFAPASKSASTVPESNLAHEYAALAEEQMSRNRIPVQLRAKVKAYFSELDLK